VILAALYLLTMFQRVMFGPLNKAENRDAEVRDLGPREGVVFGLLIAAALAMGILPQPIIERTRASVENLTNSYAHRLAEASETPDGPARLRSRTVALGETTRLYR
jgi:NADH-quinone oxidoreductase subunit M